MLELMNILCCKFEMLIYYRKQEPEYSRDDEPMQNCARTKTVSTVDKTASGGRQSH
jgi:hypothetical protein